MNEISKVWPKWDVVSVLGQGGFGTVYKVKRETFGEISYGAVKVVKIPSSHAEVAEMRTAGLDNQSVTAYFKNMVIQLLDEIKTMEKMKSASHIVAIEDYEVVENENEFGWTIYIRMELLKNLRDYMQENPMSQDEVVKMGVHILSALEFCHASDILHRDIKPDNIFVSAFGEYKLGDFGVARQASERTATMSRKGTIPYMAPEMVRLGKYGKTVDLYAIGLTMYEILNRGRMPFLPAYPQPFYPQDRETASMRRLDGEIFPDAVNADQALNLVLKKACSGDARERYQSATEMKNALLNLGNVTVQTNASAMFGNETMFGNATMFGNETMFGTSTMTSGRSMTMGQPVVSKEMTQYDAFNSRATQMQVNDNWMFENSQTIHMEQNLNATVTPEKVTVVENKNTNMPLKPPVQQVINVSEPSTKQPVNTSNSILKQEARTPNYVEVIEQFVKKGPLHPHSKWCKTDAESLAKARMYFKIGEQEKLYMLIDNSFFGKCKDGAVIAEKGIYFKSSEISFTKWEDLKQYKVIDRIRIDIEHKETKKWYYTYFSEKTDKENCSWLLKKIQSM